MAKVYLETSFISACVSNRPDTKSVYRRETSVEWWQTQRSRHQIYISAEVYNELSNPRYPQCVDALNLIEGLPMLDIAPDVIGLANILVQQRVMPGPVKGDSIHVAAAIMFKMDYLLSWNVRHLANINKVAHLQTICLRLGLVPPRILTPDVLWES